MKQLLFLLFLVNFYSFSQSIDLGDDNDIKKTLFIEDDKELYVFFKDSVSIIDLQNLKKKTNLYLNYPFDDFLRLYEVVSVNPEIYFSENHGGKIYKLNKNNVVRIDKSYTHRMQLDSPLFVKNDTIYKYGGYGFWSQRNFFTYFSKSTSEWEIVSPIGSKILPNGSQGSTIKTNKDDLYIYGGRTLNKFNPLEYVINDEVWSFNTNEKSWRLLGKTDVDFTDFNFDFPYNNKHVFYNQNEDYIYLVDVVNNSLKTYKKKTFQYGMSTGLKSIFIDDTFYCIVKSFNLDRISLIKRYEDDFFGELINEEKLYHNNEKVYYSIGVFVLILILIYLYFNLKKLNRKRNRILVENDHLVYKRKILNFDEKPIEIIHLLLKSDKETISKDIMKIVENPNLNYGHNTRVMNGIIEETNIKLKSILGVEKDLITFKKSTLDKRIKVYSIDKLYFFIK